MSLPIKKILTYVLVFLLTAVAAIGYAVYDQLSDIDSLKTTLVEDLEKQIHRNVSIGDVSLDFTGGVSIKLSNISIRNPVAGKPEFTAQNIKMTAKLLPLFIKRVEIRKLVLETPSLQITRNTEGQFSFNDLYRLLSQPKESEIWFGIFENLVPKVEIKNGEIRFLDFYRQSAPEPIDLQMNKINLALGKSFLQAPFSFSLQAEIPNPDHNTAFNIFGKLRSPAGGISNLSLDGTVKIHELYLPKFKPYMPEKAALVFGENIWLSSESGFSVNQGGQWTITGKATYLPEKSDAAFTDPAKATARGSVSYKLSLDKEKISLEQLDFRAGEFGLQGQGSISRSTAKDAKAAFSIQSSEFFVGKTGQYPPLLLFPEAAHDLVRKIFKNGTLQINTLKFDGTLEQLNNLNDVKNLGLLEADLSLRKIDWAPPLPPFQKVNGSLKLQAGEIVTDLYKSYYEGVPVAKLTGSIKNLAERPTLDWVLLSEVDLAQLHNALPKILNDNSFNDLLDYYKGIQGTGAIQITFKGPMESVDPLAIDGALEMNNAVFKQKKLLPLPVAGLKGKITFNHAPIAPSAKVALPWRVNFVGFSGTFGKNSFSDLKAEISLVDGKPFLKSSGNLRLLPEASPIALTDSFPLEGEFQPYLQQTLFLDGEIFAVFHSEGNPMVPESTKDWGNLEIKNLKLKSKKGFQAASNLTGALSYSGEGIKLKNIRGDYGKSPVKLEGEINNGKNSRWSIRATSNGFYAEDLKNLPFLETLEFTGPAKVDFSLNGSSQLLRFENKIDLTSTSYRYKDTLAKNADALNKLQFKGRVTGGQAISIDQLVYELGENKISGKGNIKSLDNPVFTINLNAQNFQIASTGKFLPPLGNGSAGAIHFDIRGKGDLKQFDASVFEGNMELANLAFKPETLPKPINLKGKIKFVNNQYDFNNLELNCGTSNFLITGGYKSGTQPALDVTLSGKSLVLDDFFVSGDDANVATTMRSTMEHSDLLSTGASKVIFNVDQFNYKFWRLENAAGNIAFKNKKLEINRLDAYASKNEPIQSQGTVSLADPKVIQFETRVWAKNILAEKLLDLFGPAFGHSLSGKLKTLNVDFRGKGNAWSEIKKSLNGKVVFSVSSGKIDTTRLKYGVFDLFGFSEKTDNSSREQSERVPFERILGDFKIRDGVAETERFVYLTADRGTSLVGKFDLNRNTMNTVVGVAPMPGLDKLLTKIPVVGRIITGGDEESLIKTYYTVEGEFSDPKVTAIPFTSLGKKVVGILQGILQTPQEIFTVPHSEEPTK